MQKIRFGVRVLAPAIALLALGACATPFRADVARFQQLPPAQGQSFAIQAADPSLSGGLEFAHYADLVAQKLIAQGYTRAADSASAQLVVKLGYDIDRGQQKIVSTGYSDPFYSPFYYGRFGYWGSPYRYRLGFHDPFLFGGTGFDNIRSYTLYTSGLTMTIERPGGERLFEGRAKAQSLSNRLTYLVPNLVSAMFEGFPGNNGEDIQVTIAPEKADRK